MGFSSPQPRPPLPRTKQPPNPLISTYTHLPSLPRADEALQILHQLASRVVPIMRKRKWRVGTLAEFLPDYHALQGHAPAPSPPARSFTRFVLELTVAGLNTNFGELINIRLRPARDPDGFYEMSHLMDTVLHELCHNVHSEHDQPFYALLDEVTKEWELLSSKGYQGQGFFSEGRRLGGAHLWYKSSLAVSAGDKKAVRDAAERRARGISVGRTGRTIGEVTPNGVQRNMNGSLHNGPFPQGLTVGGGVYGDGGGQVVGGNGWGLSAREMAARAAEQRRTDQVRCGAQQAGDAMKRETERARKESTVTRAIDLNDLALYDLESLPELPADTGVAPVLTMPEPPLPPVTYTGARPPPPKTTPQTNGHTLGPLLPAPSGGVDALSENIFGEPWSCQACTYENSPRHLACEMCQTDRIIPTLRTLPSTDHDLTDLTGAEEEFKFSFTCPMCTFRNEDSIDGVCKVCNMEV